MINNGRSFESRWRRFALPRQLVDGPSQSVRWFSSGREAMVALCQSLKAGEGQVALLPAFVPEGLHVPFTSEGWQVVLYGVDADLEPMWDDLEEALARHNPQIAVLIHYFGLPKPIARFVEVCHSYGTLVVEDMAHAYLGETEDGPLGERGDLVLYSLPKMLGVCDGAPLVVRDQTLRDRIFSGRDSLLHRLYVMQQAMCLVVHMYAHRTRPSVASRLAWHLSGSLGACAYRTLMRYYRSPAPMSRTSKLLLRHIDSSYVRAQRRRLAQVYVNELDRSRFRPFPGAGHPLNVMMGFPVRVHKRDAFVAYMRARGVAGTVFADAWDFVPREGEGKYQPTREILRSHFLFPLHQRYGVEEVRHVVAVANRWDGG